MSNSHDFKNLESNENTLSCATYDNLSQTPGMVSPDNVLSREINNEDNAIMSENVESLDKIKVQNYNNASTG